MNRLASSVERPTGEEFVPTPEDINDDPSTAPSKRIVDAISRYRKSVHGPQVAETVGLGAIRAECSRFNAWVARLESLSN